MEKGNANGVSAHGPARPTFTSAAVSPHHPLFVSENLRLVGEASCRVPGGCSLELGLPGARSWLRPLGTGPVERVPSRGSRRGRRIPGISVLFSSHFPARPPVRVRPTNRTSPLRQFPQLHGLLHVWLRAAAFIEDVSGGPLTHALPGPAPSASLPLPAPVKTWPQAPKQNHMLLREEEHPFFHW